MTSRLGSNKLNLLRRDRHDPRKTFRFFDDFTKMSIDDTTNDPTDWAIVQDAGATLQVGPADKRGGWFNVVTDGDDNDECYAASRAQAWIFNTTDEMMFECEIQFKEVGDADESAFIVGLSDTVGANTIVDAGTLMTSFDGAVFIKEQTGEIQFVTSNAATPVTTASAKTFTDDMLVRLGFFYDPGDGVTGQIIPVVDGVEGTNHAITISGLEEMQILLGAKNLNDTGTGNEQTLEVDWVEVIQRRNIFSDPSVATDDIGTPYG